MQLSSWLLIEFARLFVDNPVEPAGRSQAVSNVIRVKNVITFDFAVFAVQSQCRLEVFLAISTASSKVTMFDLHAKTFDE